MDREYKIFVNGIAVDVTEEIYRTYYKERRREKTLAEKDARHGLLSIENPDILADAAAGAEERLIARETSDRLAGALGLLKKEERELIHALFFADIKLAEYARQTGIPRKTLEYRRDKILAKLRKLMSGGSCGRTAGD